MNVLDSGKWWHRMPFQRWDIRLKESFSIPLEKQRWASFEPWDRADQKVGRLCWHNMLQIECKGIVLHQHQQNWHIHFHHCRTCFYKEPRLDCCRFWVYEHQGKGIHHGSWHEWVDCWEWCDGCRCLWSPDRVRMGFRLMRKLSQKDQCNEFQILKRHEDHKWSIQFLCTWISVQLFIELASCFGFKSFSKIIIFPGQSSINTKIWYYLFAKAE